MFTRENLIAAAGRPLEADMTARQAPLRTVYENCPREAMIVDHARTTSESVPATDPLYAEIVFGDVGATTLPVGVHTAVGGESDYPVPGEILAGAIAACFDSATRIIANRMGVRLKRLDVNVAARVDVRGTLRVKSDVPVGFQDIKIDVDIETVDAIPAAQVKALLKAAEYSCILIQTLRSPPAISLSSRINGGETATPEATAA